MTGERVLHSRFGAGTVVALTAGRIEILFDDGAQRRFVWPATARFLTFPSPAAAQRARDDLEAAEADASQQLAAQMEARRQREEQRAALYQELQRQKRSAAAKKVAANRAIRTARQGQ